MVKTLQRPRRCKECKKILSKKGRTTNSEMCTACGMREKTKMNIKVNRWNKKMKISTDKKGQESLLRSLSADPKLIRGRELKER